MGIRGSKKAIQDLSTTLGFGRASLAEPFETTEISAAAKAPYASGGASSGSTLSRPEILSESGNAPDSGTPFDFGPATGEQGSQKGGRSRYSDSSVLSNDESSVSDTD